MEQDGFDILENPGGRDGDETKWGLGCSLGEVILGAKMSVNNYKVLSRLISRTSM